MMLQFKHDIKMIVGKLVTKSKEGKKLIGEQD